jgi:glycosyltransferase involved in cell wall biosynthesis
MLKRDPSKKMVLFHRDFPRFTGGHLKVWNYFNHVLASKNFEPRIAFTPDSKLDATNPWSAANEFIMEWKPGEADLLFLAGQDWSAFPADDARSFAKPIINLIQHPRHADPKDGLFRFLPNRAIRICVSQQVADAINATGIVNGPVIVIPNGVDTSSIPRRPEDIGRPIEVLISAVKAPELGRQLDKRLRQDENIAVTTVVDWQPRSDYLDQLGRSQMVVTLPRPSEGFYLPALEAMASGAVVVCPDCVGNRDFCRDGINCFRPGYALEDILAAIYRALALTSGEAAKIREKAHSTVEEYSLERERGAFLEVLGRVDTLWRG